MSNDLEPLWEWDTYPEEIDGFKLVMTCGACPEQYDVFLDSEEVGYFRLRHGRFSVCFPNFMGEEIFSANDMKGDGVFYPEERDFYLRAGVNAIKNKLAEKSST